MSEHAYDPPPDNVVQGIAPPHSIESEQGVLGAVLLSDRAMYSYVVESQLRPEDFYSPRHQVVFGAMVELYRESAPIDVITLTEHLRARAQLDGAGGQVEIDQLTAAVPAVGNLKRYGEIVKEMSLLRRVLLATYEIQASVHGRELLPKEIVEQAERAMLEVAHDDSAKAFAKAGTIIEHEIDIWHKLATEGIALTGTPSGFTDLDTITGGFQPGNLIVVAARPSMGKSALVTNIAENVALHPERPMPVALFSLEMSEGELAQRFVASQASIEGDDLRKGRLKDERKWKKVLEAASRYDAAPLFVDDSSDIGVLEIRAKARRLHQQMQADYGGLGLIIVDYLQLMRPDGRTDSRVEQVSQMSRGLKILARELEVPVIALSQLSRKVEERKPFPRPMLSDLRECVTGETLVVLTDGRRVPIAELVGTAPEVITVDEDHRLTTATSDAVWPVGRRDVHRVRLRSGRGITATADHRILTGDGWVTVGELRRDERVAIARTLPEPPEPEHWPDDHVILLGQLIGDGSYLRGQPVRHTTASEENSRAIERAARRAFDATIKRYKGPRNCHGLLISGDGGRWAPSGVNSWLRKLGIFDQRSHQKHVPEAAFRLGEEQIGLLLQHLWATDGCVWVSTSGPRRTRVAYTTSSERLAADVSALLLRLGIVARRTVVASRGSHRPVHHVVVSGADAQLRFLDRVRAFGPRVPGAERLLEHLAASRTNTDVDPRPVEAWPKTRAPMTDRGLTTRAMAELRGTRYGGATHLASAPSRRTAAGDTQLLDMPEPADAAASDVVWDRVVSVEPAGEQLVYDLSVPGPACWLADGVVSHNSGAIEQDADLCVFIYRDEYYNPDTTDVPGEAELIIGKHRNGSLGTVHLVFQGKYTRFRNMSREYG